ncbi:MAG: triose-phosphate isomerase [candidate division WOR-3 bacterium]
MGKILPLIAGNWKMHKGPKEAGGFAQELKKRVAGLTGREVVVFPSFVSLPVVAEVLRGSNISYGAQNVFYELKGAFTGEVSPAFLAEIGCGYVIIGHSERRNLLGETNEMCAKKIRAALSCGIRPILCCGETLEERNRGETFAVVERQLAGSLSGVADEAILDIAYEPVWAIGTGHNATPEEAGRVHAWIRQWLMAHRPNTAGEMRIIYGGSVNPVNIDGLMQQEEINGVLVGGASLDVDSFVRIVNYQG